MIETYLHDVYCFKIHLTLCKLSLFSMCFSPIWTTIFLVLKLIFINIFNVNIRSNSGLESWFLGKYLFSLFDIFGYIYTPTSSKTSVLIEIFNITTVRVKSEMDFYIAEVLKASVRYVTRSKKFYSEHKSIRHLKLLNRQNWEKVLGSWYQHQVLVAHQSSQFLLQTF